MKLRDLNKIWQSIDIQLKPLQFRIDEQFYATHMEYEIMALII